MLPTDSSSYFLEVFIIIWFFSGIMSFQLSPDDIALLYASSVVTTYAGLTLFSLGLIGNSLNFITFAFWKPYRPLATSKFLATAAFSSQTYLSISIFISSLSNLIGFNPSSRNLNLCRASMLVSRAALQTSLTCVCLSSIDRYLVTSRSAYLRGWFTTTRSYLAIMITIFIWICYTIPNAVFASSNPIANICIPSSSFSGILTYLNLTFAVILPISVMTIFGILTHKNLQNVRLSTMNTQVILIQSACILTSWKRYRVKINQFLSLDAMKKSTVIFSDDIEFRKTLRFSR